MALYIRTADYVKFGINENSDLELVRAAVQRELNMDRVFVTFVNQHQFIRVDFLRPRSPRRRKRRREAQAFPGHPNTQER